MDEPKFDLFRLFDQKNNLIKDESVFEPNFIPESLLHREKELELLANYFKSILSDSSSTYGKQILIQGSVGLGKTAVVRKFGETLEEYCENNHPKYSSVVCQLGCTDGKCVRLELNQNCLEFFHY